MVQFFFDRVENIEGNEENDGYQHFLFLLLYCNSLLSNPDF